MTERHVAPPVDRDGRPLAVGDVVRVVGVPDLSTMAPACRADSEPVFRHLVGTYRPIRGWDELGHAELVFRIRSGPHAGLHFVGIEPYLLRLRTRRS